MDMNKIDSWLDSRLPELLKDLEALVAIDSERTEPREGMPFGAENARCAAVGMEILTRSGMPAKNYDNYVITADLNPEAPAGLDILAHLDVVPAGDGWTVTDPFTMKVVDDRVYGRGTADDKGPALCALYAMRAIRENGIDLKRNVRLILGCDEECGSSDLEYYFTKEKSAPYSLSPDAEFPMINIEKGGIQTGFHSDAAMAEALPRVVRLNAGLKSNVIPGAAEAVVQGLDTAAVMAAAESIPGVSFTCTETDEGLKITAAGSTGHASRPASAENALTAMLALLAALPLSDAPIHDQIRAVSGLFPHRDYYGQGIGVALEDEVSGKTVISLTICKFDPKTGFEGYLDCRACLSANDENTSYVIWNAFRSAGLTPTDSNGMYPPHHVAEDSHLVQTMLDVYQGMTGERPKPLCIGGGTYVHEIENGIAFGCSFPGLDNRLHAADEFMTLEQIRFTSRIYARAILALCGE